MGKRNWKEKGSNERQQMGQEVCGELHCTLTLANSLDNILKSLYASFPLNPKLLPLLAKGSVFEGNFFKADVLLVTFPKGLVLF